MNQYINIDSENYHYLCMFNVTDQFHVVCRSGMTSIDFDVINVSPHIFINIFISTRITTVVLSHIKY